MLNTVVDGYVNVLVDNGRITVPKLYVETLRARLDAKRISYLISVDFDEQVYTFVTKGYRAYTDEELHDLCYEHKLVVEPAENKAIMRMRMIMELRRAHVIS